MLTPILNLSVADLKLSPAGLSRQWQIGQVLKAIVDSAGEAEEPILKIAGQKFKASVPQQLTEGDLLKVRVIDNSNRPVLKIITHSKATKPQQLLEYQLRQDLPRQQKLLVVTDKLLQVHSIRPRQNTTRLLPEALAQQIKDTTRLLPRLLDLASPAGLKKAIIDSGLFMESKISSAVPRQAPSPGNMPSPGLNTDIKAGFLRLEDAVSIQLNTKPAKPDRHFQTSQVTKPGVPATVHTDQPVARVESELRAELGALKSAIGGAISKIQVNQGQTIISHEQSSPQWIIDLPFIDDKRAGLLELLIRREGRGQTVAADEDGWSVRLQLDLPALGKVTIMLKSKQGHLNSLIWAEQEVTNKKIASQLKRLNHGLEQAGFQSVSLQQRPINPGQANMEIRLSSLLETRI